MPVQEASAVSDSPALQIHLLDDPPPLQKTTRIQHGGGGSNIPVLPLPTLSASQRLTHAYGKLDGAKSSTSLNSVGSSQNGQAGDSPRTQTLNSNQPQKPSPTSTSTSQVQSRRKLKSVVTTVVFDPFNVRLEPEPPEVEAKTIEVGRVYPARAGRANIPKQNGSDLAAVVECSQSSARTGKKSKPASSLAWRPGKASKTVIDPEYPFAGKCFSSRSTSTRRAGTSESVAVGSSSSCLRSRGSAGAGEMSEEPLCSVLWDRPITLSELDCFSDNIALVGEYWGQQSSYNAPRVGNSPRSGVEKGGYPKNIKT